MLLPSDLFCWELVEGEAEPRGESIRYTLIVLLGLLRAQQAGVPVPIEPERLRRAVDRALGRPEVTPGDFGLLLWVESRAGTDSAERLIASLDESLRAHDGLAAREGLELAWIVTGLALNAEVSEAGRTQLQQALDQLLANQRPSGLFRHFGAPGVRRRFPNFATEIYSVLALTEVARRGWTTARCRRREGPPTAFWSCSCPTVVGPGSTTPSAATWWSATRSTRSISTAWRR